MTYAEPKSLGVDGITYSRFLRTKAYYSIKLDKDVSSAQALNQLMNLLDEKRKEEDNGDP